MNSGRRTAGPEFQAFSSYFYYEDANAALDWLSRVFGFVEVVRYVDADGVVQESEMRAGETVVQVCGYPDYWSERGVTGPVGMESVIYVEDADALWERVTAAGVPADAPQDMPYGVRAFGVKDPEGHSWSFWQRLSDEVKLQEGWRAIHNQ